MAGTAVATRLQTHLETEEELATAWNAWNACDTVLCKGDGAPIALTVDATVATYRFVCTHCGNSSPWFEATSSGLLIHASPLPNSLDRSNSGDF